MGVEYTQNSIHPKRVKQATGQGIEDIMSQKAVTDEFGKIRQVPAGTQGQIVGFDANGNPVAVADAGGTGVFTPVTDLVELKALDTTLAEDWPDKWAIYVESVRLFYALDRESLSADDGDTVIAPTTGAGRWHRKVIPLATPTKEGLLSGPDKGTINKLGFVIPKERVQQVADTIDFRAGRIQSRALTADLTITAINNPVLDESILYEVDGSGNAFTVTLPASVTILNSGLFATGKKNYIYLHCVDAVNNKYVATISQ